MTIEELRTAVADGTVDTVLLAIADMEGRLQGKRLTASHFLAEVLEHGAEGCNYLLAVDVDMETVDGYEMSSWERGYGDFEMKPDLSTLRPIPWQEGTVLVIADLQWEDGSEVVASPRQILRRQLARLAERGLIANAGTELEFIVFKTTYEDAWRCGYRDLDPANLYNVDYSLLGTSRVEPLIRRIRNEMAAAGPDRRELEGRVQPRPARDQLPLRRGAADRRRARDLQERRQGDRRPGGALDHLHGEVQRARGQLVPHPLLARRRRGRGANAFGADDGMFERVPRRPARLHARDDADVRSLRQLLQALRARLLRPDRGRLGTRQPDLLDARRRPRRGAAGREPAARRRRQPLPGAERDDRRRPARHRQPSCRSSPRSRATPTPPTRRGCRPTSTSPATCSAPARSPARRSARRSSTTT